MGALVLDASILIALLDEQDHLAPRVARSLARHVGDTVLIPASALAETLVEPVRRGTAVLRRTQLEVVGRIVALDGDIALEAARLRARARPLRLPDALVVATGEVLGATVLTGDRSWKRHSSRVEVV